MVLRWYWWFTYLIICFSIIFVIITTINLLFLKWTHFTGFDRYFYILISIFICIKFIIALCQLAYFLIISVLEWCQDIVFMIMVALEMPNLLFGVENNPALYTENISIGFLSGGTHIFNKCLPFWRVTLNYHYVF